VTDSDGASGSADPYVLAIEVIGLIAFGRADGFINDASQRMFESWGGEWFFPGEQLDARRNPLARVILRRLVKARRWRRRRPMPRPDMKPSPRIRAALRLAWRRHGRRPFLELLPELLTDIDTYPRLVADLEAARKKAVATFAATADKHDIKVIGRKMVSGRFVPDMHVPLDRFRLFADERRTITNENWLLIPDRSGLGREIGPEYGDVKIRRADLEKFVPVGEVIPPPKAPAPPEPKGPAKPPRLTPRQRLADALTSLHKEGVDIHSPPGPIDSLHTRAMDKAKIKASKATFERALADARRVPSIPSSSLNEGNEGS